MEKQQLTNPEIIPDPEVLEAALGNVFPVIENLFETVGNKEFGMDHEWRYYNDGKAWLCKAQFKKKTVFWLSIWENYFKVTFYFTEKHLDSLLELPISQSIKDDFKQSKHTGKLIPLTVSVQHNAQIEDLLCLVDFKKKNIA